MNSNYLKYAKFAALAALLPFVYGCGGSGAGVGSLVGFLFGSGGSSAGDIALLGSTGGAGILSAGGAGVASLVNPEPASMLLLGGGLTAMAYFKSKSNRKK